MNKLNLNILYWVKVFNKGLEKEDKKEGLWRRLKDNEGKNEEQLKAINNQGERQLKLLESDANSANTKEFQSLKFLYRLKLRPKNGLI